MIWSQCGIEDAARTPSSLFSGAAMPAPSHTGGRRRATRTIALAATALLTALSAGSAVAARSVTVTLVSAHGRIADLLPASTVLYAGATLAPSGSQGATLRTLESAFTAQPGFATMARQVTALLSSATGSSCNAGSRPVTWDAQFGSWINGTLAVAVTDPAAFRHGGTSRAAQDDAALVVGLKVRRSLADLLTQHQLGSATRALRYGGVDLYAIQHRSGCGTATSNTAATAYAAVLNGYAVVGLTPRSVEREIDVYRGLLPALSRSASYQEVAHTVSPDGLAFVYLDTPALLHYVPSAGALFSRLAGASPSSATRQASATALYEALGPTGLALSAQPTGFSLQLVQLTRTSTGAAAFTPNRALTALPDGSLFYLSLDNLKAMYRTVGTELARDGVVTSQNLDQFSEQFGSVIDLVDGEYAIGLLPTNLRATARISDHDTTGLPLVLLVDVARHPEAVATVQRALRAAAGGDPSLQFTPSRTVHGDTVYSVPAGYGYARIGSWLVASTAIKHVAASIEGVLKEGRPSMASGTAYHLVRQTVAGRQVGVLVVDLRSLRASAEALLADSSPSNRRQYAMARPLLLPLRALTISGGSANNGHVSRVQIFLAVSR
jgi:hypothetical protein